MSGHQIQSCDPANRPAIRIAIAGFDVNLAPPTASNPGPPTRFSIPNCLPPTANRRRLSHATQYVDNCLGAFQRLRPWQSPPPIRLTVHRPRSVVACRDQSDDHTRASSTGTIPLDREPFDQKPRPRTPSTKSFDREPLRPRAPSTESLDREPRDPASPNPLDSDPDTPSISLAKRQPTTYSRRKAATRDPSGPSSSSVLCRLLHPVAAVQPRVVPAHRLQHVHAFSHQSAIPSSMPLPSKA